MKRWVTAAAVMVAGAAPALGGAEAAAPAAVDCGTRTLYGRTLELRVVGPGLTCEQAREIARGRCREGRVWSCFSFRPPAPMLVWFKEDERFERERSTVIEARRYPCSEAHVSRRAWRRAVRSTGGRFPTRMQLLADDLMRCDQLDGKTIRAVRALLGRPHHAYRYRGMRHLEWEIGPERDSFFQIDSEVFTLRFDRHGVFDKAAMIQG